MTIRLFPLFLKEKVWLWIDRGEEIRGEYLVVGHWVEGEGLLRGKRWVGMMRVMEMWWLR